MRINHNIAAMNTYRQLSANNTSGQKSLEKLSSGLRINRAGDDAAGLAISEKMRGQIRGLDQASRNAQDGISMIQTAEGALNETQSILQRMRELAVQAATDTNTSADRTNIQSEIDQLALEVTRISTDTEFNTKKLLNGNMGKTMVVTANTFTPTGVQAIGSDLGSGSYTLTLTNAGTETNTVTVRTAATALVNTDITVASGSLYGDYTVDVTNFDGVGNTADLTLTRPDGTSTTLTGAAIDGNAVSVGNITFDFSVHNITGDGSIEFSQTSAGLEIDLSGTKTVNASAITAYAGETLNIGGFQFSVKTGHGVNTNAYTVSLTDNAVKFQIGANANQSTNMSINDMSASALSVDSLVVTTQTGANTAITTIEAALTSVSSERAKLGAMQNRLEHTISNLGTTSENLAASESRIRDVDMAKEMTEYTKNNILSQAAQAMLAQANQAPQGILQLLR